VPVAGGLREDEDARLLLRAGREWESDGEEKKGNEFFHGDRRRQVAIGRRLHANVHNDRRAG
jgi:hypothetical protein